MIAVALKGLLGRKTRAILTALAIVLGTGMISATFIFTDTLNHAFDGVFSKPYEHTSVVVSGKQIVTGAANTPSVPASLVARIRTVPGVEAASGGFLFATVKLVGANGKAIGNGGPQFGFGVDPADKRFTPLVLTTGRWPSGPGEIAVGAVTAAKEHLAIGDTIGAKGNGAVHHYTITGLAEIPGVSAGSATLAAFDVATAQVLLGKQGRYDSISVIGSPDVKPRALATRIRPLLSETETVRTASAEAASVSTAAAGSIARKYARATGSIASFAVSSGRNVRDACRNARACAGVVYPCCSRRRSRS
jgi:putative ABC transport system permease protein